MKYGEISGSGLVRRRDKRIWFLLLGVFVAMVLYSFMVQKHKQGNVVDAANLAAFDPGYIISDFQMENYNTMNETDIQVFLKSKNSCNDNDLNRYTAGDKVSYFSEMSPPRTWHIKDGHFVCMADEVFDGGTAAHIIYRAAQDYRINPQVLLVLLEKEQSLVRDTFPHSQQYRSATGYGCPDTAACSSKYYGLQNQIRNAAALFRTVLDGGWTNYPLGNNYVQYNPNAACGGTVVNIRNLATSALYRYTPYQPNAATLAGGSNGCSAYGNLNFYRYFQDWFGGITEEKWESMTAPRIMKVESATLKVDPFLRQVYSEQWAKRGYKYYFVSKTDVFWGGEKTTCLRTAEDTRKGINRCIIMDRMKETDEMIYDEINNNSVILFLKNDTFKIDLKTGEISQELKKQDYYGIKFSSKVRFNDEEYYRTTYDVANNIERFVPERNLEEISFIPFKEPRNLTTKKNTSFIDLSSGQECRNVHGGFTSYYTMKIEWHNKVYYRTEIDKKKDSYCVVSANDVEEYNGLTRNDDVLIGFQAFIYPRQLRLWRDTYLIDVRDGSSCEDYYPAGTVKKYLTKIDIGGKTFYRDDEKTSENSYCVVDSAKMQEL